jgi:hypothetical protein
MQRLLELPGGNSSARWINDHPKMKPVEWRAGGADNLLATKKFLQARSKRYLSGD